MCFRLAVIKQCQAPLKVAENGTDWAYVCRYRPHLGHTVIARSPLLELIMYPTLKEFDPVIKEIVSNFTCDRARQLLCFPIACCLQLLQCLKQSFECRRGDI